MALLFAIKTQFHLSLQTQEKQTNNWSFSLPQLWQTPQIFVYVSPKNARAPQWNIFTINMPHVSNGCYYMFVAACWSRLISSPRSNWQNKVRFVLNQVLTLQNLAGWQLPLDGERWYSPDTVDIVRSAAAAANVGSPARRMQRERCEVIRLRVLAGVCSSETGERETIDAIMRRKMDEDR